MRSDKQPRVLSMRYLHVISSLDPAGGGPAEGVLRLCAVSCRKGHHVEIVTLDAPTTRWSNSACCPVHNLGPGTLGKYRFSPRLRPWLHSNAQRFDAVIVNGLWQYQGLATRAALQGTGTPYFVFTHGMLDPWFRHEYPLKHAKKWLYWPWGEYRVLRDARAVLFTCEEERRQARASFPLYRANEAVVAYGTPGFSGDAAKQREAFLDAFPQLRGKRLLLFLGRIHPKKGVDLLVDAFAQVAHRDPELHLVIAGPDSGGVQAQLEHRAEQIAPGRISWIGMVQGDIKWGAFHSSDAFILPSHQENFGIAVAEALSCGVPVLISDKVNIWREIEADGAGLVANDTSAGTLDLLARWMALDASALAALRRNARPCFELRFHIEAASDSLRATLQRHLPAASPITA
jgi:glycosyltransferase involved in cell wall biosynthesis